MIGYYIKDLFGLLDKDLVVKKDDIIQNLITYSQMIQEMKDVMGLTLHVIGKNDNTGYDELLPIFKKLGLQPKNTTDIVKSIYLAFTYLENTFNLFAKEVEDSFGAYTARDAMNVKQVALLEFGENIFIAADGLEYLSILITEKMTDGEPIYKSKNKFTLEYIYGNISIFKALFNNALLKELKKISTLPTVPAENNKLKVLLPKRNFTGKFFYNIASWWFLKRAEVIERKKATKKLLELRVLELKDLTNGEQPTMKVKKEIEYYESVIAELDKEIHEFYTED